MPLYNCVPRGSVILWTELNCIYFFFFSIWAQFQNPLGRIGGGGGGSGPPTPGVQPPTPAQFFPPYPHPLFFLIFSRVPRPKFRFFAPPPPIWPHPPPIFRQKPPYPCPLTPPCPPHASDKHIFLSHKILLRSLEAMNFMASRLHNILWYDVLYIRHHIIRYCEFSKPWDWLYIYYTAAEVPATFQSDHTILNTNLVASKNLQDLTIRRLIRCFNIR